MSATADAPKKPREKIPQTVVLDWLQKNHPSLHATAELDRAWVWITENLQGDTHKATRNSIKHEAPGRGFVFAKRGGHKLPSGKLGTWGHSCDKPMPFRRKAKGNSTPAAPTAAPSQPSEPSTTDIDEALAFAMGQ